MSRKIAKLVIKYRVLVLILVLVGTVFLFYEMMSMEYGSKLEDILPNNHSYVKLNQMISEIFGGNNLVSIGLIVKEGNIFNPETFAKIHRITRKLEFLDGVVPYRIISIATDKLRYIYVIKDPGDGMETIYNYGFEQVVKWIIEDKKLQYIDKLEKYITNDPSIYGPLVSKDKKGTVILCDFWSEENYKYIFENIHKIVKEEKDSNTEFYIGGRPIELGYLNLFVGKMLFMFGIALVIMMILLFMCFRGIRGMFLPLMCGLLNVIWTLGIIALFKVRMDMMSLTVPFLILAIAISHSVQIMQRYYEEYDKTGDNLLSCEEAITAILPPAFASILTDSLGFASIAIFPIKLIRSMGAVAGVGILTIFLTSTIFLPVLNSILPKPNKAEVERAMRPGVLSNLLNRMAALCLRKKSRIVIIVVTAVLAIFGAIGSMRVVVGDTKSGSPFFWRDSTYNQHDYVLNNKFGGTNPYIIYIDAKEYDGLYDPQLAAEISALTEHLQQMPEVGYIQSYIDFLKAMNMAYHKGDQSWNVVPPDRLLIADFFDTYVSSVAPEVTRSQFELDYRKANIQVFLRDHKSETIRKVIKETKDFLAKNHKSDAVVIPAGGIICLFAAIIEEIENKSSINLTQVSIAIFLICSFLFRSLIGGLIILMPLGVGKVVTFGTIGFGGIGYFLHTVPAIAPGMGIGVDYSIYILQRMREELVNEKDYQKAHYKALTTSGKAVIFTALSVVCGVLVLCLSELRFQAIMGTMLSVVIISNMLAALFTLPVLISIWKPKFLFREGGGIR